MTAHASLAATLAVLLIALAPAGAGGSSEPDRGADYIGPGYVNHGLNTFWVPVCEAVVGVGDCPVRIPSGITWTSCDTESWLDLGQHQGVGGVLFCAIPQLSLIEIEILDQHVDAPLARITCLSNGIEWHAHVATVRGKGTALLPWWCTQISGDPPGTTRVGVFLHGPPDGPLATMGTVNLTFL